MAVVWRKTVDDTLYEVRSAGRSRRLYTDGVLHSQFNPASPLTGSVWDLLLLPALFYPPGNVRRVLVLGVGGGAVIRQLSYFLQPEAITGVELNPIHLYVAERFFRVKRKQVVLHHADAVSWVGDYQGPPFDMIIEDLFGGRDGEPVRAVKAGTRWFDALLRALSRRGVLAMNFVSADELGDCAYFTNARVRERFPAAFRFSTPYNDNAVGAFLRRASDSRELREHMKAVPGLNPNLKTSRLRFGVQRL
jgi:spermidine synthase